MPLTRPSYARAKSPLSGLSILMTRAPRSASWRVQKGAAIACSKVTTVIPSKGRIVNSKSTIYSGYKVATACIASSPCGLVAQHCIVLPSCSGRACTLKLAVSNKGETARKSNDCICR